MRTSLTARAPTKTLFEHYLGFLSTHNPRGYRDIQQALELHDEISGFIALVRTKTAVGLNEARLIARSLALKLGDGRKHLDNGYGHNLVAQMAGYRNWLEFNASAERSAGGKRVQVRHFKYATDHQVAEDTMDTVKALVEAQGLSVSAKNETQKLRAEQRRDRTNELLVLLDEGKEAEFLLHIVRYVHPVDISKLEQAQRDGYVDAARYRKICENLYKTLGCHRTGAGHLIARILGHVGHGQLCNANYVTGPNIINLSAQ